MSSFCFNFPVENNDADICKDDVEPQLKKQKLEEVQADFKEITAGKCETKSLHDVGVIKYKLSDEITVSCYDATSVEDKLKKEKDESSVVVKATSDQSDLIPNQYEGGLTVWECGIDLAIFMTENVEVKGQKVLELGCGAGIPGICAVYLGADVVHFQDYNSEVIEEYTIPNVTGLNIKKGMKCKVNFFSGDWLAFATKFEPDQKYDTILTAETIYNPDNYQKLHDVFTKHLDTDGKIYVAAKSNYFGVGGGTRLFENFIDGKGQFSCSVCHTISAGVPREIIKLIWKKKEKDKTKDK